MVMRVVLGIVVVGALAAGCKQKAPPTAETVAPMAAAAPAQQPPPSRPPIATAPSGTLAGGDDPCPAICDRTRPLKCKRAAACRETCGQMRLVDTCVAEMAAVMSCFARQPLSSWECSEEGDAAMKDGLCDTQQGQFVRCIEHGAGAHPSGTHL